MKKSKKIIALVLCMLLMISAFTACGGKEETVNTGETFTYWVALDNRTAQTTQSYNDLIMYKEMEKATGTKVEFLHASSGTTGSEAFQILLSGGNYPDMIEYRWTEYSGGGDQAIADGVIIALNDYMEEYAPNYYSYMEGEKAKENNYKYKIAAMTTQGNYYGFNSLFISKYGGYAGIYVRKDMLDKWGLDIPVTIDDWTNVLKTAKENGIKYPLTGQNTLFSIKGGVNAFNTAWKVGKSFYLNKGKVKFGPFEPEYKEYLAQMADWVKKGYVDIDFVTNSSDNVFAYITNGTSIASYGYVGSGLGKLLPAMAERDPDFNVVACPYPVMKKGDKALFQPVQQPAGEPTITISTQCGKDNEDRTKEAIKWCDYLYSDEGIILKSFGVEGVTYTVENDENGNKHYRYTDAIYDHEKIGAHSVEAALYHFMRPGGGGGFSEHPDYLDGFYVYDQQKDAIKVWNKYVDEARGHVLPSGLPYLAQEATRNAQIQAAGRDNLDAAILNIILGRQSLESFDNAIKAAKKAGYDELIKIEQAAYERYLAKLDK